jgi:uncharacterized protein (DUF983 family)
VKTQEEIENETDVLNELIDHYEFLKGKENKRVGLKHTCPRCRSVTILQTDAPYCSYCNWDSLEDQTNFQMD